MFVPVMELYFVDEFLDVLFFGAGAYHQHVVGVHDDVFLQAADDRYLALGSETMLLRVS